MQIHPKDLGARWHILLVQERTQNWWSRLWRKKDPPAPRLGALGRLWNRRLEIDPEVAAATFPLSGEETLPWVYGLGVGTAVFAAGTVAAAIGFGDASVIGEAAALGVSGAGAWLGAVTLPRAMLRRLHERPVSEKEIEDLLGMEPKGPLFQRLASQILERLGASVPEADDPLERAFLSLVLEVLRQEMPAETQEDVRAALRALGEAIAGLPPPLQTTDEMTALRQKAAHLSARAREEPDAVVAASRERQADALLRQADAAEETNRLARRVRVVREEMATQIAALRAGIAVFRTCRTDEAAVLHRCAEAVRGVASEAAAVAAARRELDDGIARPAPRVYNTPNEAADAPVSVRRR